MKKSKLFLLGVSIFALASCKFENITDSRASDEIILEEKINETKTYLSNQNLKKNLFGNVLQSKLKNSLVYNINENEYLVEFNESSYKIDSNGFEKISNTFNAVNTVEDAFKEEIGTKIFTKGYYSANDGGNGYFEVLSYIDIKNPDELLISIGKLHINTFRNVQGVEICVSVTEDEAKGNWRVSLRSTRVKIGGVASQFEGGGHDFASGCKLATLDDLPKLINALEKAIEEQKNVGTK